MHLIWTIVIGFLAGLVAKWLTPGAGPSGFFLTAALGIGGALAATFIGQAVHWYTPGESAGFLGAVVGAVILLVIYHVAVRNRA